MTMKSGKGFTHQRDLSIFVVRHERNLSSTLGARVLRVGSSNIPGSFRSRFALLCEQVKTLTVISRSNMATGEKAYYLFYDLEEMWNALESKTLK